MIKNEKGSVTMIVIVTVLFMLLILSASLAFVSTKRQSQLQESEILQDIYGGGDLYKIYEEQAGKDVYISNGLLVRYDAINNTGTGTHSNTATTWKNLAGSSNYDGQLHGATFKTNYLSLDGTDDWVAIGDLSGKKSYTLDITFQLFTSDKSVYICSSAQNGGLQFITTPANYMRFQVYSDKKYQTNSSTVALSTSKIYNIVGTYDGSHTQLYFNGVLNNTANITGEFGDPANKTIFVLGGNPSGTTIESSYPYAKMNVYTCRLYDRALSAEEVKHNYDIDNSLYKIE